MILGEARPLIQARPLVNARPLVKHCEPFVEVRGGA